MLALSDSRLANVWSSVILPSSAAHGGLGELCHGVVDVVDAVRRVLRDC